MPRQNADDAILEDVSDAEPEVVAPVERPKTRRELDMEAIEASQLRRLEEETGVKLTDEPAPLTPEQEQLEAQLADEVITDTEGKKIRIKVDGVEQDIDLSEAVRTYQKGAAADKRLEEATRLLREAEAREKQAAPAPAVEKAPEPQAPVVTPGEVESQMKEAFDKLYEGDSGAAVKVFTELLKAVKGGEQPTPTPAPSIDEIADQLQQRLAVDTAFETIRKDYPDVIANKDIELLTAIKVNQKIAAGTSRATAMLESAEEVYTTLGKVKISGRVKESQSESQSEKLKRKANLDPIQSANVAAAEPAEDEPGNPSSLIQEMAAARLGQSMPVQRR